jgi:hypothetical protein
MYLTGLCNQGEQFLQYFVTVEETSFNMGHLAPYKHPQPENTHYLTQQGNSKQRHQ